MSLAKLIHRRYFVLFFCWAFLLVYFGLFAGGKWFVLFQINVQCNWLFYISYIEDSGWIVGGPHGWNVGFIIIITIINYNVYKILRVVVGIKWRPTQWNAQNICRCPIYAFAQLHCTTLCRFTHEYAHAHKPRKHALVMLLPNIGMYGLSLKLFGLNLKLYGFSLDLNINRRNMFTEGAIYAYTMN